MAIISCAQQACLLVGIGTGQTTIVLYMQSKGGVLLEVQLTRYLSIGTFHEMV